VHAHEKFVEQFQQGMIPEDLEEVQLAAGMKIANVIKEAGLASSTSDALRMIQQGAVKIDGERLTDMHYVLPENREIILQAGKRRFIKLLSKVII